MLPHLADVDGDGVAEQHQHQGQRGEDLERLRLERELHHAETGGAQHGAEEEEDRDLGHARPLDRARQQRGGDDDDADERERGDEGIVEHGPHYGSVLAVTASRMVTWIPDAHERADRHRHPAHHLRNPAAGERALQPGVPADRRPDRAVLPPRRHAGRIRGDRRDPVCRLPARLPHRSGGARAHPLRRRTQHPARRGAPSLGTGGRCRHDRGPAGCGAGRDGRSAGRTALARRAGARCHRLVHRRGRHVRRASGQRASAQAPGGRDAGGRVRRQRSRRGHPDHHARLQPPRRRGTSAWARCSSKSSLNW